MTSSYSNENRDVFLEILEPNLIVLQIPEKGTNASIFLEIEVFITNEGKTTFPFVEGLLTAELFGLDGQALSQQKLQESQISNNPYRGIGIPPKRSLVRSLRAELGWQNEELQLETTIHGYFLTDVFSQGAFQELQAGNYQLRLSYSSPKGKFLFDDGDQKETTTVEVSPTEFFLSEQVTMRLVEPVGKSVEVDGIRFETKISETIIQVSSFEPGVKIPLQIGMRITNNTSTPYRFVLFDSLIPQLIGAEGLIVSQPPAKASLGWIAPSESQWRLAMPGKSLILSPQTCLKRQANGRWQLIVYGWTFNDLKLGKYKIELIYKSLTEKSGVFFEIPAYLLEPSYWKGKVATPFVEFHLVES